MKYYFAKVVYIINNLYLFETKNNNQQQQSLTPKFS